MPELKDDKSLFQRIAEETVPFMNIPPQEDEFTIMDFISANTKFGAERMNRNTARARIADMLEAGVITKRKGNYNGKSVNVYRFTA